MLILKLLEKIDFFSEFTDEERALFAGDGTFLVNYEGGEYIVKEGVKDDGGLYVLLKGTVLITKNDFPTMVVNIMGEGDIIGEASFLSRQARTATAMAKDDVTVFKVDRKSLENLECPLQLKIKNLLFEIIITRLNNTNNTLMSMLKTC
jgi:CRP/FNR family transcriptional regulator, cyclic AMP receptor protein